MGASSLSSLYENPECSVTFYINGNRQYYSYFRGLNDFNARSTKELLIGFSRWERYRDIVITTQFFHPIIDLWSVSRSQREIQETMHRPIQPSDYGFWKPEDAPSIKEPLFTYLRFDESNHWKSSDSDLGTNGGWYLPF